jgi:hypothetical protein
MTLSLANANLGWTHFGKIRLSSMHDETNTKPKSMRPKKRLWKPIGLCFNMVPDATFKNLLAA